MGLGGHLPYVRNAEVDPLDIPEVDRVGLVLHDPLDVEKPLLEHLILGVEQPLFPLGMGRTDRPVKGREKDQSGGVSCLEHIRYRLKSG